MIFQFAMLVITRPGSSAGRHEDSEEGPQPRRCGTALDRPGGTAQRVGTTDQGAVGWYPPRSSNMANRKWTIEVSDFPMNSSIHSGFSIAMFDFQRVEVQGWSPGYLQSNLMATEFLYMDLSPFPANNRPTV